MEPTNNNYYNSIIEKSIEFDNSSINILQRVKGLIRKSSITDVKLEETETEYINKIFVFFECLQKDSFLLEFDEIECYKMTVVDDGYEYSKENNMAYRIVNDEDYIYDITGVLRRVIDGFTKIIVLEDMTKIQGKVNIGLFYGCEQFTLKREIIELTITCIYFSDYGFPMFDIYFKLINEEYLTNLGNDDESLENYGDYKKYGNKYVNVCNLKIISEEDCS